MRNESFLDVWSLSHLASGFVAARLKIPRTTFAALAIGYEVVEYSVEHPHGSPVFGTKRPESFLNLTGDLLCSLAGYWVGEKL